ncbi:MAG: hypothetical protein QM820_34085 [Minicystis sp.]
MRRLHALSALALGALAACSSAGNDTAGEDGQLGEASSAIVTDCDYLNPTIPTPALAFPVDFDRELVIRHLGVVEDPCRTTLTPTVPCAPGTVGIYTFVRLMEQMAGTVPVQAFIADFLHSFEVPNTVNGFPVPARPGVRPALIDKWLLASGCAIGDPIVGPGACPLDMLKAPFRLLAIVNRVDIADWTVSPPVRAGEARFVFGITDVNTGAPLPATVILEYKLPNQRGGAPYTNVDWANAWHALSDPALGPIGSPAYNATLQNILGGIVPPGSQPGNPNFGAAIGQVRVNEIAFGPPPDWKLREYNLKPTGAGFNAFRLRLDPLNNTPDDSMNHAGALDTFLFNNSLANLSTNLRDFLFSPPPGLLGGVSTASAPPFVWDHSVPATLAPIERHHFAFATCNGCHTGETNTGFTHISPRITGAVAGLSPFLGVSPAGTGVDGFPAARQIVTDPTGHTFEYNEPHRRRCEVTAILKGAPLPYTRDNGAH